MKASDLLDLLVHYIVFTFALLAYFVGYLDMNLVKF